MKINGNLIVDVGLTIGGKVITPSGIEFVKTTTAAGGETSLNVNVPQSADTLIIDGWARENTDASNRDLYIILNGDTASNYDNAIARFTSDGAVVNATNDGEAATQFVVGTATKSTLVANSPPYFYAEIPMYTDTTRQKSITGYSFAMRADTPAETDMFIGTTAGRWKSTAAITQVSLTLAGGTAIKAGSFIRIRGLVGYL